MSTYRHSSSNLTGNGEQIRSERIEAQVAQGKGQILIRRSSRKLKYEADDVDRPEIIILHRQPQALEINSLSVMHISLGRIVSQNSINYDDFLSLSEPTIRSEPSLCLGRRGSHCEPGPDAYRKCDTSFNQKEPSPTSQAVQASHAQNAERQDWSDDVDDAEGHPEECEAGGEFSAFEVVRLDHLSADETRRLMLGVTGGTR